MLFVEGAPEAAPLTRMYQLSLGSFSWNSAQPGARGTQRIVCAS